MRETNKTNFEYDTYLCAVLTQRYGVGSVGHSLSQSYNEQSQPSYECIREMFLQHSSEYLLGTTD